ncbi:hypothetical protein ANANG_G00134070, partial [Anguilla anguilla]
TASHQNGAEVSVRTDQRGQRCLTSPSCVAGRSATRSPTTGEKRLAVSVCERTAACLCSPLSSSTRSPAGSGCSPWCVRADPGQRSCSSGRRFRDSDRRRGPRRACTRPLLLLDRLGQPGPDGGDGAQQLADDLRAGGGLSLRTRLAVRELSSVSKNCTLKKRVC